MTLQCYICGRSLNDPTKCILCNEYVCQEHSRSFEVGQEKSDSSEKMLYAYICDRCMEAVEELKRKPREEWTEEDKAKSKGMIGKILTALGKAGMAIIAAIFAFALWLFAKGAKQEEAATGEAPTIESNRGSGWDFPTESIGDTSFAEENTFKEDEPTAAM